MECDMNLFVQGVLVGLPVGAFIGIGIAHVLSRGRKEKASAAHSSSHPSDFEALLGIGGTSPTPPRAASQEAARLRQDLRTKFLHDEQKVIDAIALERERSPNADEIELLKLAIYRYERDNR
jgi:hypothetical protein